METAEGLVLVVDDNDATRYAKSQTVRRAGFSVIEAETGRQALDLARRHPVDVVLLDINLPDISGIEVCGELKADDKLSAVQVLQISATAVTDGDKVRGLSGGADAYLIEPCNPDVMLATLRALLRVRRAELDRAEALDREREARALAERANRAKDDFLAVLSHELRTPLNTMFGRIAQLKGGLDEAQTTKVVDALDRSAHVLLRLINDLLDVASIREGKLRLEMSPIDLDALCTAAVDAVRAEAARKGIDISSSCQPARTTGDQTRLQQVITNLLNNSIKYTSDGGRIRLTIAPQRGFAVISVEDTGIGIDPEFLPHVFDQFRQADATTSNQGGLGLGLAIARDLVELHGGTISAASKGLGHGSTFTVRIPLRGQTTEAEQKRCTAARS